MPPDMQRIVDHLAAVRGPCTGRSIATALQRDGKGLGAMLRGLEARKLIVRSADGWSLAGASRERERETPSASTSTAAPVKVDENDLDLIVDALGIDRAAGLTEAIDEIRRLRGLVAGLERALVLIVGAAR
jgi:hypothetical protein